MPLPEETKKFSAFITPFDVYQDNRLPFGWKNSPAWFQKMTGVLKQHLGLFCNIYIDYILVHSQSEKEHPEHLAKVLQALSDADLKINEKKSEFFKSKVVFLGRVFDGATKSIKQERSLSKGSRSLQNHTTFTSSQSFLDLQVTSGVSLKILPR